MEKLKLNCASQQFQEDLPKLPDSLVNLEAKARACFARSLSSLTSAESLYQRNSAHEAEKVLAKMLFSTYCQVLLDFALARKKCRTYVFKYASIRHEPIQLIDSSWWGPNFFPAALVDQTLERTAQVNRSLRGRWGLSAKRKSDVSSSNKSSKRKQSSSQRRGTGTAQYRILKRPHPQQPPMYAQPGPSTSQAAYAIPPPMPYHSPAYQMPYEQDHSLQQQGTRGRGCQRRGKGRGNPRQRGNSQRRGAGRGHPTQ